jgi:hypothetical protein
MLNPNNTSFPGWGGIGMISPERSGCLQMLLDLVCYEIQSGRLSPEMSEILADHLADCPSCRQGVRHFQEVLVSNPEPQ